MFFNFPWQRGKNWCDAEVEDLLDFEDWRRWSPRNPERISGAKWDRELAALALLYKWAAAKKYVTVNPVLMREMLGRRVLSCPRSGQDRTTGHASGGDAEFRAGAVDELTDGRLAPPGGEGIAVVPWGLLARATRAVGGGISDPGWGWRDISGSPGTWASCSRGA
ncbi:hypothetical protein [Saccharopolyspora shandongensis]|uniref:hypothetical protein n=1 Tax=Saccharopolyspora shandongensis TaxID=418495 RepID=UPI0033C803B6